MSELSHCPNDECFNEDITVEPTTDHFFYVYCDVCGMEGPVGEDRDCAADVWNSLPRVYDDDADDDDTDQTMATVVRMLSEKEYENKDLTKKFSEEQQVNENLRRILKDAQGAPNDDLADKCRRYEATIKQLQATARSVDLAREHDEKRATSALANVTEKHEKSAAACRAAHAEIQTQRIRARDAEQKIKDWEHSMFLIDLALVSLELAEEYPETVPPPMSRKDLLEAIRDKQNWPPDSLLRTFDTALGEIVWLSSPYGKHPAPGLYLRAIQGQLTTDPNKDIMISEVYGLAMERFGQGSKGYNLAWNALGRPGETKHDVLRPRT